MNSIMYARSFVARGEAVYILLRRVVVNVFAGTLVGSCCLGSVGFAQDALMSPEDQDEVTRLVELWWEAPPGSQAGAEIEESIKSSLELAAPNLHEALLEFWNSPTDSDEEARALQVIEQVSEDDLEASLLLVYASDESQQLATDIIDLVGSTEALPARTVDLALTAPESVEAGDQVTVFGRIRNLGTEPVWIVDRRSTLTVPIRVWGFNPESIAGSLGAHFPTTPTQNEEILRTRKYSESKVAARLRFPGSLTEVFL